MMRRRPLVPLLTGVAGAYVLAVALEGGVLAPDMQRRCGLGNLAEEAAARAEKLIEVLKGGPQTRS